MWPQQRQAKTKLSSVVSLALFVAASQAYLPPIPSNMGIQGISVGEYYDLSGTSPIYKRKLTFRSHGFEGQVGVFGTSGPARLANYGSGWTGPDPTANSGQSGYEYEHSYRVFIAGVDGLSSEDVTSVGPISVSGRELSTSPTADSLTVSGESYNVNTAKSHEVVITVVRETDCGYKKYVDSQLVLTPNLKHFQIVTYHLDLTAVRREAKAISVDTRIVFAKPGDTSLTPSPNYPAGYANFSASNHKGGLFAGSADGVTYDSKPDRSGFAEILLSDGSASTPVAEQFLYGVTLYCYGTPSLTAVQGDLDLTCSLCRTSDANINALENNAQLLTWAKRFGASATPYTLTDSTYVGENPPPYKVSVGEPNLYTWTVGAGPSEPIGGGQFDARRVIIAPASGDLRWKYFVSPWWSEQPEKYANKKPRFIQVTKEITRVSQRQFLKADEESNYIELTSASEYWWSTPTD